MVDHKEWMALISTITEGLEGTDVPTLDLGEALYKNHSEEELHVHKFIDHHPNEIAHAIAAREILDLLKREKLIK